MFFGQAVPTISTGHRHRENLGGSILHAERRTLFDRGGRGALEWAESGVEEESTPWELEKTKNLRKAGKIHTVYRSLHLKNEFDMYFIDSIFRGFIDSHFLVSLKMKMLNVVANPRSQGFPAPKN